MESLKYKCLVLDHDDTVVNSTATIHYPAFVEIMKTLRPQLKMSLNEFYEMNCHPGFVNFCQHIIKLNKEESILEFQHWKEYVAQHVPIAYEWMKKVILKQKELGGYVCVASHSLQTNILRDYKANNLPLPDLIFGKELPLELVKPSPYAINEILKTFKDLTSSDILVVDDLKPGYAMAKSSNVKFAAACWAHNVPEISSFMKKNANFCFYSPEELYKHLFINEMAYNEK